MRHEADYEPTTYYDCFEVWLLARRWLKYLLLAFVGPRLFIVCIVSLAAGGCLQARSTRAKLRTKTASQLNTELHKRDTILVPALYGATRLVVPRDSTAAVRALEISWEGYARASTFEVDEPANTFQVLKKPAPWTCSDNEVQGIGSRMDLLHKTAKNLGLEVPTFLVHADIRSISFADKSLAVLTSTAGDAELVVGSETLWTGRGATSRKLASRGGCVYFGFRNSLVQVPAWGIPRYFSVGAAEDVLDFAFLGTRSLSLVVVVVTCVDVFVLDLESGQVQLVRSLVSNSWSCLQSWLGHRAVSFRSVAVTGSGEVLVLRSDAKLEVFIQAT